MVQDVLARPAMPLVEVGAGLVISIRFMASQRGGGLVERINGAVRDDFFVWFRQWGPWGPCRLAGDQSDILAPFVLVRVHCGTNPARPLGPSPPRCVSGKLKAQCRFAGHLPGAAGSAFAGHLIIRSLFGAASPPVRTCWNQPDHRHLEGPV